MTKELDLYGLLAGAARGKMTLDRIKAIRKLYGATQSSFAELIMVNYETYRKWEQGKRFPSSPGYAILCIAESYPKVFLKNWRKIGEQVKGLDI
jgi:DNA-binding transcriptional regulator YiaG